jgi:hypothetical protein
MVLAYIILLTPLFSTGYVYNMIIIFAVWITRWILSLIPYSIVVLFLNSYKCIISPRSVFGVTLVIVLLFLFTPGLSIMSIIIFQPDTIRLLLMLSNDIESNPGPQ